MTVGTVQEALTLVALVSGFCRFEATMYPAQFVSLESVAVDMVDIEAKSFIL